MTDYEAAFWKLKNNWHESVKHYEERIEKLEAALAHIYAWYPISVAGPLQTVHEIRDFARKALEGEDG